MPSRSDARDAGARPCIARRAGVPSFAARRAGGSSVIARCAGVRSCIARHTGSRPCLARDAGTRPGVPGTSALRRAPGRPRLRYRPRLRALLRDARGAASVWAIFWTMMMMIVSGFTLDVSNAYRVRALLQATADASALAAARLLPDEDAARDAALALARINMPPADHGEVMPAALVEIGSWRGDPGAFVVGHADADTVRVTAARGGEGGIPVPTFLVGLLGRDEWHVAASATARARSGGSGQMTNLCPGALVLSGDRIGPAGGSTYGEGVCIHGQNGAGFGGDTWFHPTARVSAADIENVDLGHLRSGSATRAQVAAEQSLQPVLVPQLGTMFDELWAELFPGTAQYYYGDLLPDFVKDPATGRARIQRVNQWWWTVQPGDLQPYTIYLVNHGMQLAGGVDAQNVAVLARGQIGVGGGPALRFDKVFFFGTDSLNFSGNIGYGDPLNWCEAGVFDVYLFSMNRLSLGGWGGSAWLYNVMAAAETIDPGGAMKSAGGLYMEARQTIQFGGNYNLSGCPYPRESHYDAVVVEEGAPAVIGGTLVQ